jgi:hypothetical protein
MAPAGGSWKRGQGEGLIEFCERFDAIALWIDPDPNSQLTLIWVARLSAPSGKDPVNLALVQADAPIGDHNSVYRWWGGTELTSDRLWRWDPANRALITPR